TIHRRARRLQSLHSGWRGCTRAATWRRPRSRSRARRLMMEAHKPGTSWGGSVLESRAMAFTFPSPEWAAEFKKQVQQSSAYRQAAATWTFGPVALLTRADPAIGLPEDIGLWLDIDRGNCSDVRVVSAVEASKAPFCITGE